ncbi:MAG: secondary thiamine-phosphate synthase enzyme YjbQ [Desulfobacteraceae bacterium]|nr:secondary thiamine-phosphate synthase enzyme YjbQ [Desulfobacteraceae bacterium]
MNTITLDVSSRQKTELIDITPEVQQRVAGAGFDNGICMVYVPHTTAAVTINESADPAVARDIIMVLNQIVPWKAGYRHMEGNSPAHVKAGLVGESVHVAVNSGDLQLGTWQGIFFCEFDGPRSRRVRLHLING